jgi:hypothetical protein
MQERVATPSVHQHGAAAALPFAAAELRPGEPQLFAEHVEQRAFAVGLDAMRLAVDLEFDRSHERSPEQRLWK